MELTDDEYQELLRYANGARFSGAARRMLGQFLHDRGLHTQAEWDETIKTAVERYGASEPGAEPGEATSG